MVLAGAGVGGGSLNYANTLYVPPKAFFDSSLITDWQAELKPYYDQAGRMLGVRLNPTITSSDVHLKAAAQRMGVGDSFHMAPVGVFFGDGQDADGTAKAGPGGEVEDPYFGAGPARKACTECGECMTGCLHGAKNTLNENYLYLAEKAGAVVHPMTTVVSVTDDSQGGYARRHPAHGRETQGRGGGRSRRAGSSSPRVPTARRPRDRDQGGRPTAVPLPEAGRADPHQLRGAGGRADRQPPSARRTARPRPTSPRVSPSPPRSTRTRTPTSSPSATARARTPWGPSILQVPYAEGSSRVAGWLVNAAKHPLLALRSLSTAAGPSGPSSVW